MILDSFVGANKGGTVSVFCRNDSYKQGAENPEISHVFGRRNKDMLLCNAVFSFVAYISTAYCKTGKLARRKRAMGKKYQFFWEGEAECLPILLELLWQKMQEIAEI